LQRNIAAAAAMMGMGYETLTGAIDSSFVVTVVLFTESMLNIY